MDVFRPKVKPEPSLILRLHHSLWQHWILIPPSEARDQSCLLTKSGLSAAEPQWELPSLVSLLAITWSHEQSTYRSVRPAQFHTVNGLASLKCCPYLIKPQYFRVVYHGFIPLLKINGKEKGSRGS